MIRSSPQLPAGSLVRATRQQVDEDAAETWSDGQLGALLARGGGRAVVAEVGSLGRVVDSFEGGGLMVAWEGGHPPIDCFLGEDCEVFMQLLPGGIA